MGGGDFCEIKEVVDNNAIGARTVIASDLNGDGWIDLASASKVCVSILQKHNLRYYSS